MSKIFKDGITQDSATGQIYQVGKSAKLWNLLLSTERKKCALLIIKA